MSLRASTPGGAGRPLVHAPLRRPPACASRGRPSGGARRVTTVTDVHRCLAAVGLVGLALAGGCSLSLGGGGAGGAAVREAELRIWASPLVFWEAGGDRRVDFAIENGSTRTLMLATPDPAYARVTVFRGADGVRACGVEPRSPPPGAPGRVEIPAGGSAAVRVDLGEACARVPPGEYRFEVDYRSPPLEGAKAFSGTFATRYGEIVVEGAPAAAQAGRPPSPRAGRAPPRAATRRGE